MGNFKCLVDIDNISSADTSCRITLCQASGTQEAHLLNIHNSQGLTTDQVLAPLETPSSSFIWLNNSSSGWLAYHWRSGKLDSWKRSFLLGIQTLLPSKRRMHYIKKAMGSHHVNVTTGASNLMVGSCQERQVWLYFWNGVARVIPMVLLPGYLSHR